MQSLIGTLAPSPHNDLICYDTVVTPTDMSMNIIGQAVIKEKVPFQGLQ